MIECFRGGVGRGGVMADRREISDEVWAVIVVLLATTAGRSRPRLDHQMVVEAIVWRYHTGAPLRDVPARFGPWNTVFKRFDRWAKDGTRQAILTAVRARADAAGQLDWTVSIDSTIARVHQHGATLARATGGAGELHVCGRRAG